MVAGNRVSLFCLDKGQNELYAVLGFKVRRSPNEGEMQHEGRIIRKLTVKRGI